MRLPEPFQKAVGGGETRYRKTGAGLLAAAFLAPFAATQLAGPLTVGRATALLFAALLLLDLLHYRPWRLRLGRPAPLLAIGYVGLSIWIVLNMSAIGCNCYGKAGGFLQFATIGLLALVALGIEPRLRGPALAAVLAGTVLAAILALLGVGTIDSGSVDLTQTGGRLSGTYGNANELGFAVALGLPIALAFLLAAKDRRTRFLLGTTIVVLVLALVLTYSRGSIITAGAGVVAIGFWEARGSRRRMALTAAGLAVAVVLAAGLYSVFQHGREQASFHAVPVSLRGLSTRDVSGWDRRAKGPIPAGPSTLSNRAGGIVVHAGPGEGVSIRWGEAAAGARYTLLLRARAMSSTGRLALALGDSVRDRTRAQSEVGIGPRWRRLSLAWRPRLRAPHANLYLWNRGRPLAFALADVRVVAWKPGGGRRVLAMPRTLDGSIYAHLTSAAEKAETRYLHSRLDAAREALHAFASAPIWGIGWQRYPAYADEHLDYGPLAAHNQYLAIAAELGAIGLVLAGFLLLALALGVRRYVSSEVDPAPLAILGAAVVGVVFVEALPVPQLSIPLAIAAAIVCRPRIRPAAG